MIFVNTSDGLVEDFFLSDKIRISILDTQLVLRFDGAYELHMYEGEAEGLANSLTQLLQIYRSVQPKGGSK